MAAVISCFWPSALKRLPATQGEPSFLNGSFYFANSTPAYCSKCGGNFLNPFVSQIVPIVELVCPFQTKNKQ